MAVKTDEVQRGSQRLAAMLLRDVQRIAEASAARMQELLPSYARVPRDALTPVVVANTRNILEAIRDPDADRVSAQAQHEASGATRARQGITSDEMLHAWRIGLDSIRERARVVAAAHGIGADVLLEFVEATLRWGDIGMRESASAHHEAEVRELGRLVEEQAALRRVATLVAQGAPSERLFAMVAEQVARVLDVPSVGIASYDTEGTVTVRARFREHGGDLLFPVSKRWSLEGTSVMSRVRDTGRPARINDYTGLEGPLAASARASGNLSTVGVPIVVAGRVWGTIVVSTPGTEPLPAEIESRLVAFGELVAVAISNANARAEVERLAEEQAALRRVATLVAREAPAEDVFARVAEEVGLLLGVETAAVQRYEPEGDASVVGLWGALRDVFPVGHRFSLEGESVTALVFRGGRSARLDTYEHVAPPDAASVGKVGLRSSVGGPIVVNGRLWGAIAAATTRAEPLPADAEARIAQFTELVATAISNTQARSDLAASRARIVATADAERRRVVRDLHDGAQQRLVHSIVTLKMVRRALEEDSREAASLVDEALEQTATANDELRKLAHGILPSVLTHGGLGAAVRALASRMSIPVDVDIAADRLPRAVEATAYFLVSEALTNVAKHSHADRATVVARLDGRRRLEVEVCDDGVGGARADGTGLVGLGDRLAALGGTLRVESPNEAGTRISASIPVPESG